MKTKVLFAYMAKCREHNWKPNFKGLHLFANQIKSGIRNSITFEWN